MKRIISLFLVGCMVATMACGLTTSDVADVKASGTVTAKFPYNVKYEFSKGIASFDNATLLKKYKEWTDTYVTSSGCPVGRRVQAYNKDPRDQSKYHWYTCSEGMGYGMLLAAYFNDQAMLDDLWAYARHYTQPKTGLMRYYINEDMTFDRTIGPATDGDMDMAMALILADKMWGSSAKYNYKEEATRTINNLYKWCVEEGTYVLNGGDWGGTDCTDPSYYATAWFKIFADYTNNPEWLKVVDKCYEIIGNVNKLNNGTGIMPDWCSADGTPAKTGKTDPNFYKVSGDAFRCWWRYATDAVWFGDERAINQCQMLANYFKNQGGVDGLRRSYKITGESSGVATPHIVSMAGCVYVATGDTAEAKKYYDRTKLFAPADYYSDAINILGMTFMSGNMPNFYNGTYVKDVEPVVAKKKTVKLTSVKPGKLTTKTVKITGKTTAKATVTLRFGNKKIKSVKANKKGKFTLKKLKLKKYKGKKLTLVATKSGMVSKTKKFTKIKK